MEACTASKLTGIFTELDFLNFGLLTNLMSSLPDWETGTVATRLGQKPSCEGLPWRIHRTNKSEYEATPEPPLHRV